MEEGRRTVPAEEEHHIGPAGAGPGGSRIELEREVARRMAGSHSLVEAGENRTGKGPEKGRHILGEWCTARRPGIRPAGADTAGAPDTHPVAVHRAAGSRPAGIDTGAAAAARPDPARRHIGTANLASRILTCCGMESDQ